MGVNMQDYYRKHYPIEPLVVPVPRKDNLAENFKNNLPTCGHSEKYPAALFGCKNFYIIYY